MAVKPYVLDDVALALISPVWDYDTSLVSAFISNPPKFFFLPSTFCVTSYDVGLMLICYYCG